MQMEPTRSCAARSAQSAIAQRAHYCDVIETVVTGLFGIAPDALRGRTRGDRRTALARQTAMYVAHVGLGLTRAETGRMFARDRSTVAHACRIIEERRDDPMLDLVLMAVENACGAREGSRP